jgi:hypothetical protein
MANRKVPIRSTRPEHALDFCAAAAHNGQVDLVQSDVATGQGRNIGMAGNFEEQPAQPGSTPVPDLIERYRVRRDAWIAQADELARLRDEVRGSAEREAMEIVTAARRDVRKIIMEARRELLVLSAQVQAALGEGASKADPSALLHKAGIASGNETSTASLTAGSAEEAFAPERAVDGILDEVQGDMTALAEDARTLPMRAEAAVKAINGAATVARPAPVLFATTVPPSMEPTPPTPPSALPRFEPEAAESPALSRAAADALLSPHFPSEAVAVPAARPLRAFVAAFAGIGVVVAAVTGWWLWSSRAPGAPSTTVTRTEKRPEAPAVTPASSPAAAAAAASAATKPGNLTLAVEAVRDVWVRTIVDGKADQGRTLAAGQSFDVSAEQRVSLRAGDAGALVVSVNRGEKRPLGRDGQVITRDFVADGATPEERPAPSAAPPAREAAPSSAPAAPPTAGAAPVPPPPPLAVPMPVTAAATPATATPVPVPTVATTPAAAPPAPAPAPTPTPARPETAAAAPNSPATAVVAAARQWLDAYHRQDRTTMAALSTENLLLADERRSDERLPAGLNDVTRTLDRVSVQIAADTAVLTAVMTEQSGSFPTPRVSPVSQVWVLAAGQWKVRQARFVSEARLNQVFR